MKRSSPWPLIVLLLGVGLSLSACFEKDKPHATGNGEFFSFGDENSARKAIQNAKILCQQGVNCPDSVAGLLTLNKVETAGKTVYLVGYCSATLIGSDIVMTNKHCIPEDLRNKGALCSGRITVQFPKTNIQEAASFDCESISGISGGEPQKTQDMMDWAFIKIGASSQRNSAVVSLAGIEKETKLQMYPVQFSISTNSKGDIQNILGEIQSVTCESDIRTGGSPFYFHKFSGIFLAQHCSQPMTQGNSGTGAFSTDAQVVGVVSFIDELNEIGGSNLACVPELNTTTTPSVFCATPHQQEDLEAMLAMTLTKMYSLMAFYEHVDLMPSLVVPAPEQDLVPPGSGFTLVNREEDEGAKHSIYTDAEFNSYRMDVMSKAFFRGTGLCVSANAAADFELVLSVNDIMRGYISLFRTDTKVVSTQMPVNFHFTKVEDHFKATISLQTLSKEEQRFLDYYRSKEVACMLARHSIPVGEKVLDANKECELLTQTYSSLRRAREEQALRLNTNLFLNHWDAKSLELEIPICE